jgi:Icc-related predicted phosphoesterase
MLDRAASLAREADAVLYAGDFAALGRPETAQPYLERLANLNDRTFAVSGNCDEPDFREILEEYDISVEGSLSYFSGLVLTGSGGGSKFTGKTPNERDDEELAADLRLAAGSAGDDDYADYRDDDETDEEESEDDGASSAEAPRAGTQTAAVATPAAVRAPAAIQEEPWNNLVVIMHNPPKDTACDQVAPGVHVGSPLLRQFIDTWKPLLVVCGHIHESFAIERLGPTVLVNPGSLAEGRYAVAEITGGGKVPFAVSSIELKTLV